VKDSAGQKLGYFYYEEELSPWPPYPPWWPSTAIFDEQIQDQTLRITRRTIKQTESNALMSEEVHTGTITLWLGTRGYGFIKDDVPSYKGVFLARPRSAERHEGYCRRHKSFFQDRRAQRETVARDVHIIA
jgi:hypothetical protein